MLKKEGNISFMKLKREAVYALGNYNRAMLHYYKKRQNNYIIVSDLLRAKIYKHELKDFLKSMSVVNPKFNKIFDEYPTDKLLYKTREWRQIKKALNYK